MSKLQNRFTTCALAPKSVAQFLTALGFVLGLMAFTATSEARGAPDSFADLAQRLLPAVVNISTTSVVTGNRGQQICLSRF